MSIIDVFSKRQKKYRGEVSDVYQYDKIPNTLRVQLIHIVRDTIGVNTHNSYEAYRQIHKVLCKEYGVFSLLPSARDDFEAIYDFFLKEKDVERCLDVIELSIRYIDGYVRKNYYQFPQMQSPDDAIEELNLRFKESSVGFQYVSGELIRVDSQFLHSNVAKPVLNLLGSEEMYLGANDEFLSAFEHYRHKRYKESMNECLKSFESVMKAIHDKYTWPYGKGDAAQKLINSCLANQLIPDYLQTQFSSIKGLLESGTPTVRNKESGHGQGAEIKSIPEHFASYALHLTATNLLFLIECEKKFTP
ncbi:STM4504/CBY_0614 family protein [Cellvibrio sp. QJXJ]|uniref:STM4504/CBY_0614 family protein n=1 Tax=Cellvibrio sp. QJXJ TaxID=2964606 RepID=UPI0021C4762F|nr:hypothetical protein [Cellvibrio sp. QJXJ]UUA73595.1 hypothetical protein NNX04_03900 [Cellvibrio sp. QJXJ]